MLGAEPAAHTRFSPQRTATLSPECTAPLHSSKPTLTREPVNSSAGQRRPDAVARRETAAVHVYRLPTASLLTTQDECHRRNSNRLNRRRSGRQVLDLHPLQAAALDVSRPSEARQDFLRMDQTVFFKAVQQPCRAQATTDTMPQGLIIGMVDILRDVPFEAMFCQRKGPSR